MVLAAEPPEMTIGSTPGGVERLGAILVDQRHRALRHVLRVEIGVVGVGEDVDQRIAQAQNLDRLRHRPALKNPTPRLSHCRMARSMRPAGANRRPRRRPNGVRIAEGAFGRARQVRGPSRAAASGRHGKPAPRLFGPPDLVDRDPDNLSRKAEAASCSTIVAYIRRIDVDGPTLKGAELGEHLAL